MVLAFKIFVLNEKTNLNIIALKLKDFERIVEEDINSEKVEIGERIIDLDQENDILSGKYEEDYVIEVNYRGKTRKVPVSKYTPFWFIEYLNKVYLVIGSKKLKANRLATIFSEIIFAKKHAIIEGEITHETLKTLHESRPSATKVIFFSDSKIPNINKLALYGPSVTDTTLYTDYLKLGKIWYVVFEVEDEIVIGLTRNCVTTIFSKISLDGALNYIYKKIVPLIH